MIKPRPYQADGIEKIVDFFKNNGKKKKKPHVYVAPVASGKSIIIGGATAQLETPTIVLQPSKELLEQNYSKFIEYGGEASIFSASVGIKEIGHVTYATLGSIKIKYQNLKN